MTSALQDALYDCDWLPYDAWEDRARVDGKVIRIREEDYRVLVLPAVEVIPWKTLVKAREFLDAGGVVVGYGFLPTLPATLGKTAADIAALRTAIWGADPKPGTTACLTTPAGGRSYLLPEIPTAGQIQAALAGNAGIHATLEVLEGETNNWLHVLHRRKAGRDVFLVCNQDHLGGARTFRLRVTAPGEPECWDAMRNEVRAVPCRRNGDTAELSLTLEPSESVLLVFQADQRPLPPRGGEKAPQLEIAVRDVRAPADKTPSVPFKVMKATYGIPGDPKRSRDAREQLQRLIAGGERQIRVGQLQRYQGNDPARGAVKTLQAELAAGDRIIRINAKDNETVALSDQPPSARYEELKRLADKKPYTGYQSEADPFKGIATVPDGFDPAKSRVYLEFDSVPLEDAAAITINGQAAGGVIGRPFRLEVTKLLKTGDNGIVITPFAPKTARLLVFAR
jgi:hypothetical protein